MYVVAMCLGETLPILHIDGRRRSMNVNYMFRLLVDQSSQPNRSIEGSLVAQGLHTVVAKKRNDGDDEIQNVCLLLFHVYLLISAHSRHYFILPRKDWTKSFGCSFESLKNCCSQGRSWRITCSRGESSYRTARSHSVPLLANMKVVTEIQCPLSQEPRYNTCSVRRCIFTLKGWSWHWRDVSSVACPQLKVAFLKRCDNIVH